MSNKRKIGVRNFVQILFFIIVLIIAINHTLGENGKGVDFLQNASLHAICPFGGVVTIYEYLLTGGFIKKIHESSFILMIIMFIMAIGFGPLFCGWICPFGTFQEWVHKIGKKIFKKSYNNIIPIKIDKYLRYLRYIVLFWVIYVTGVSGKIVFQDVDPYYALFNFWSGEVAISGIIMLFIIIILGIIIERPWCKYMCPYGAVLGITNFFRIFKIIRREDSCISCKLCDKACPMDIKVSKNKIVKNHQCISCMRCTSEETCPIENTVTMSTKGGM